MSPRREAGATRGRLARPATSRWTTPGTFSDRIDAGTRDTPSSVTTGDTFAVVNYPDADRRCIVDYDELVADPMPTLQRVCAFLRVGALSHRGAVVR